MRRHCNLEKDLTRYPSVHSVPYKYILEQFPGCFCASPSTSEVVQSWFLHWQSSLEAAFPCVGLLVRAQSLSIISAQPGVGALALLYSPGTAVLALG